MDTAPVLVAFDPSTGDPAPVRFGIAAARFSGAPLVVVSVHSGGALLDRLSHSELRDVGEDDARRALENLRGDMADELRATFETEAAHSAARGLHAAIERTGATLAVIGSTNRGAVGRVATGSTAERVIDGAACAVAVVPSAYVGHGVHTVGAAFVRSDEGRAALRAAAGIARAAGAKLRVITVLADEPGAVEGAHAATTGVRLNEQREEHAAAHRREAELALAESEPRLTSDFELAEEVIYGSPAELLIDISRHLDLLVTGSRAYGPQRALLLGGVSRRVIAAAHCPVLVLPRGVELSLERALAAGASAN
jgi:nucleotide-binding universal stress UspA family protein